MSAVLVQAASDIVFFTENNWVSIPTLASLSCPINCTPYHPCTPSACGFYRRLCVESKLPQGSNITASSNDPYEFTLGDHHPWLGGSAKVGSGGMNPLGMAGHNKPIINKQKVKASSSVPLVNSPGSSTASLRTPVTLVVGNRTNVATDVVPSGVRTSHGSSKRKRSGVVLSHASNVVGANSAPNVNQLNLSAVSTSHMNNPISIAIPVGAVNVNLGSAAIGSLGMSSVSAKHQHFARNNLFKDLNIVVTNIDGSGLVNGHLVTIPGIQLATESVAVTTHNHIQTEKASAKAVQSGRVVGGRTLTLKQSQQVLMPDGSANSLNAIVNAMSVGGAVVMDTAPPPGTVVAPSSMQMAFAYGNTGVAPSTTPSPLIRSVSHISHFYEFVFMAALLMQSLFLVEVLTVFKKKKIFSLN